MPFNQLIRLVLIKIFSELILLLFLVIEYKKTICLKLQYGSVKKPTSSIRSFNTKVTTEPHKHGRCSA